MSSGKQCVSIMRGSKMKKASLVKLMDLSEKELGDLLNIVHASLEQKGIDPTSHYFDTETEEEIEYFWALNRAFAKVQEDK